uniref:apyrase n=1 Tax=Spodoptera frugiperda TaxID=7108 RepID=A0A2H1V8L5_SPOFR
MLETHIHEQHSAIHDAAIDALLLYMKLERVVEFLVKTLREFEETSVDTPSCRYNNNSCIGGFPRLYKEIHTLLEEKPNSIVLNAGDSFQGTYWYTLLKWNVTQEFMNLIPHDAHALGNHEFDDGPEGLAPYLKALKAPVLAANMDVSEEPILAGLFIPHIVLKRKGRKIGIIGLITPDTAVRVWNLRVVGDWEDWEEGNWASGNLTHTLCFTSVFGEAVVSLRSSRPIRAEAWLSHT